MVWYYAEGDRQRGPISDEEFQELVNNGRIRNETLIWKDGMENWQRFESVDTPGLASVSPGSSALPDSSIISTPSSIPPPDTVNVPASLPGARCAQCGRGLPGRGDGVQLGNLLLCHNCDAELARHYTNAAPPAATAAAATGLTFASILSRAAAKIIDNLVETVVLMILVAMTIGFDTFDTALRGMGATSDELIITLRPVLFGLLIFKVLYDAALVGFFSATLGKMVLSIRVVSGDGSRVRFSQAIIRAVAPAVLQLPGLLMPSSIIGIVAQFIFIFGYIIAVYDVQKRTLYDHLANTRVVR